MLNTITKRLYDISCADPSQIRWTEGVPLMIADSPSQESPSAEPSDSVPLMIADSPSQESPSAEPSDSVQSSAEQTDHISLSTDASQPTRITFTFNIKGWSADQTRDFIVGVLSDYKTQLNNGKPKKPLWSTFNAYLTKRIIAQSKNKKPNVSRGREQIVQLCREYDIVLE